MDPWDGVIGQERTFTFTALMSDAASFTYRIGDGPETTVPASAGGTAQAKFTPIRFAEAGAGANFRGGFQPVFLRFPATAPGSGCDRRDSSSDICHAAL
jgi:hypothetical protein